MYKIVVIRSLYGHYNWKLLNGNDRKIAESNMTSSKENSYITAKPIAKLLKCKIEYIDLEIDCEE